MNQQEVFTTWLNSIVFDNPSINRYLKYLTDKSLGSYAVHFSCMLNACETGNDSDIIQMLFEMEERLFSSIAGHVARRGLCNLIKSMLALFESMNITNDQMKEIHKSIVSSAAIGGHVHIVELIYSKHLIPRDDFYCFKEACLGGVVSAIDYFLTKMYQKDDSI